MPVVRRLETRRTETPAAVMTTLASPTQGGAATVLWRVDMQPGAAGPVHVIDAEQVWTFLDGTATVDVDGVVVEVSAGDTLVVPAGVPRQITAGLGFVAIVACPAGMRAYVPGAVGDRLVPAWVA